MGVGMHFSGGVTLVKPNANSVLDITLCSLTNSAGGTASAGGREGVPLTASTQLPALCLSERPRLVISLKLWLWCFLLTGTQGTQTYYVGANSEHMSFHQAAGSRSRCQQAK